MKSNLLHTFGLSLPTATSDSLTSLIVYLSSFDAALRLRKSWTNLFCPGFGPPLFATMNIGVLLSLGCCIRILAAVKWVDISSKAASSPTAILNCFTNTGSVVVGSILCSKWGVWPTSYLCREKTSWFSIINSMYWFTHSPSMPEESNCDLRFSLAFIVGFCVGFLLEPGGSRPVACNNDDACSNWVCTEDIYSNGEGWV